MQWWLTQFNHSDKENYKIYVSDEIIEALTDSDYKSLVKLKVKEKALEEQ